MRIQQWMLDPLYKSPPRFFGKQANERPLVKGHRGGRTASADLSGARTGHARTHAGTSVRAPDRSPNGGVAALAHSKNWLHCRCNVLSAGSAAGESSPEGGNPVSRRGPLCRGPKSAAGESSPEGGNFAVSSANNHLHVLLAAGESSKRVETWYVRS